jgi:hypothetical protein
MNDNIKTLKLSEQAKRRVEAGLLLDSGQLNKRHAGLRDHKAPAPRRKRNKTMSTKDEQMLNDAPIIISVHKLEEGKTGYVVNLDEFFEDPTPFGPVIPGIMMSDLLDHIVNALHHATGRDQRDIRTDVLKAMRDEDRFKQKDPARSGMEGKLLVNRH